MRRIRIFCVTLFTCGLLAVVPFTMGGCNTDSKQRIAAMQTTVTMLQERSAQADSVIAQLQASLDKLGGLLADANDATTAGKLKVLVAQVQAQIEAKLAYKTQVDAELAKVQTQLAALPADPGIGNEIQLVGSTTSGVGQVVGGDIGSLISLVGVIIGGIGGIVVGLTKSKVTAAQTEAATAKATGLATAFDEVVAGGESFKETVQTMIDAATSTDAKAVLQSVLDLFGTSHDGAQTTDTKKLVAAAQVTA